MTAPVVHVVTFERNTRTGQWRGFCSGCFWCLVGTQEEVQSLAATHDLEWQPVAAPAPQPEPVS